MAEKTNVIEWEDPDGDDMVWVYPYKDVRWGSQLIVREYEACVFMRDGKIYDVFNAGRHVITTQNAPLLTRAFRTLAGYGETPFKIDIVFISTKQQQGKFGLNFRLPISRTKLAWMTEAQTYGDYWYRIDDPVLFLTQVVGGVSELDTTFINNFIRNFFVQAAIEELSKLDLVTVQSKLFDVTTALRAGIGKQFQNRGMRLLETKFGSFTFPYLEKLEEEDPTYGVPLMAAMQAGEIDKALDMIKVVESMRGLGKSSGAGVGAGLVAVPQIFGNQPYYGAPQQGAAPAAGVAGTVQSSAPKEKSLEEKLMELKDLLDKQLITKEEYTSMRKEVLNEYMKKM